MTASASSSYPFLSMNDVATPSVIFISFGLEIDRPPRVVLDERHAHRPDSPVRRRRIGLSAVRSPVVDRRTDQR
jgi:hypothetical protein